MVLPGGFDIRFIADRLGELSEVEKPETGEDSVRFKFSGQSIVLQVIGSQRGSRPNRISDDDADRVLVLIDEQVLEAVGSEIYVYDLGGSQTSDSEEAIVGVFQDILSKTAEYQSLSFGEVKELPTATELAVFDTPQKIAEIVAGWAVTNSSDRVLDIATGSGELLAEAADQRAASTDTSVRFVGLDNHPFACGLARSRFRGVEAVEIVNTNFLTWNLQHGTGREQASLTDVEKEDNLSKFDAVIGAPPSVQFNHLSTKQRDRLYEWAPGRGHSVDAAFVAKAVTHLDDGGRGAFLVPKTALRGGLIENLAETCALHRIVALPIGAFPKKQQEVVILTVVKEERSSEVRETGVGKFTGMDLPNNARGLFEQPLDGILANRYNTFDAELVKAAHEDLDGEAVMRLLSSPSIYDVLTEDGFTRLGDFDPAIEVGSGATSGDNRLFYFDEEERQVSDIDDRFFRPLIKDLPDNTLSITEDDITQYVLDLYPYLDQVTDNGSSLTDEDILEQLEQDGYDTLIEHLQSAEPRPNKTGSRFTLMRRGKFQDPDLVLPEFFDETRCYTVDVDGVIFDSTVIGIRTDTDKQKLSLHRLLNTPLYKEFLATFGSSMNLDWYRINLGQLRDVPVIEHALTGEVAEKLDVFLPPDDDNDVIGANQVLIEACGSKDAEQALQRYMASRDDYAWSWFLTLPEVERFQKLVEQDRKKAQEFIIERFDQELLDKARQTFNQLEFFEQRRDLLNDLLMEFESNHYRSFLAGITLQFEGILTDLVLETGGKIVEQDGETEFKLPGKNRSQQKNLHNLISTFFDGIFSTFMHETIRQRRNAIAHGDIIEDDRALAIHFFIAFYALCYASLAEYTRLTDVTDRMI